MAMSLPFVTAYPHSRYVNLIHVLFTHNPCFGKQAMFMVILNWNSDMFKYFIHVAKKLLCFACVLLSIVDFHRMVILLPFIIKSLAPAKELINTRLVKPVNNIFCAAMVLPLCIIAAGRVMNFYFKRYKNIHRYISNTVQSVCLRANRFSEWI